ncbi:Uncharacterised protein [Escherichia coli]|uniref:hypothetical protein n=1 Tax=Escherichia coli TaxID=562 RepID=UPI0006A04379|nr:hypothetical protein [Escherichia coli]CTS15987.1 Uncharacterised protein [Escherichia coli]
MKIILECREIRELPLIEREVSVNNNKLTVTFSLIGDLDFEFSYYKIFPSHADAIHSAEIFIASNNESSKPSVSYDEPENFAKQQVISKEHLLENIINNSVKLPDEGNGFVYNGDLSYVATVLERIRKRASYDNI